ncbi:hypothetical protein [Thermococcus sp.]
MIIHEFPKDENPMPNPLTKKELLNLIKLVREAFGCISELKSKNDLARWIQYPKVPSILSESLVFHLVRDHILPLPIEDVSTFKFRTKEGDILFENGDDMIHVEVKATGKSKFQYLGEKDIKADYLIWVNFEDFFERKGANQVKIITFERIGKYITSPRKITLSKLKEETKQSGILCIKIDIIKYLEKTQSYTQRYQSKTSRGRV